MKNEFQYQILSHYGSSLGAAIRNSLDPADPDQEYYRTEIAPARVRECYQFIETHGLDPIKSLLILNKAVDSQIEYLTSGFLTELRADIQKRGA